MLRTIIISAIIIFFNPFEGISQHNEVDSMLFVHINNYRAKNGLNELKWDYRAHNMSKHHTEYLHRVNTTYQEMYLLKGHNEDRKIPGFKSLNILDDRIVRYVGENPVYCNNADEAVIVVVSKPIGNHCEIAEKLFAYLENMQNHIDVLLANGASYGGCSYAQGTTIINNKKVDYFVVTVNVL